MTERTARGLFSGRASLRTQTAMAMAVTVATALLVVLVLLLLGAGRYLRRDLETRARDYALLSTPGIAASYERYHESGIYKLRQQMDEVLRRSEDVVSASVVDVNGVVLFDSASESGPPPGAQSAAVISDPWALQAVRKLEPSERRLETSLTEARYEVVSPYVEEWGRHRLSVRYRFSYARLRERLVAALLILGSASGLSIGLAFIVGSLAARRVSRPLARMTEGVQRIGSGERASRIEIERGAFDELRVLAEAFNAMADDLDRHIATLEAKNAELDQYAYTASHELKTPLITIRAYADQVAREAASLGSEGIRADASRIAVATSRMSERLDDLLNLARLGRVANPVEAISMSTLATEAVDLCAGALAARGVTVSVQPDMLEVTVDRVRFVEVLQNLIENAIKFAGNAERPSIEIGMTSAAGERTFFVKDNGIGIDPRYHERVFGLFDKLDARSEGSGVGLAVVKRIVEFHGGRIWIESDGSGRGTTFRFTLPSPGD